MNAVATLKPVSRTWTFFEGEWREGNIAIMGPRTHAAWLGSTVFDGARAFEGVTPDLAAHCARVNHSAEKFLLKPVVPAETWIGLALEGVKHFDPGAALYIRPMYWADQGFGGGVKFDPETTRWCLTLYEAPMPVLAGVSVTLSPFRRPTMDTACVEAKASCLYPNNTRALIEAQARGFDNCILRDILGAVAETANANIFMVKDGVVFTPAPNGVFLDGITRRRVIGLLRGDGLEVREQTLMFDDFLAADEIFTTGNYAKVSPITRIEQRELAIGPLYRRARALYWAFAHAGAVDAPAVSARMNAAART
jgi:branched-chain amino acid aminotransferase